MLTKRIFISLLPVVVLAAGAVSSVFWLHSLLSSTPSDGVSKGGDQKLPCCFRGDAQLNCDITREEATGKLHIKWSDGKTQQFSVHQLNAFNDIVYLDKEGQPWQYFLGPNGDSYLTNTDTNITIGMPIRDRYCL